MIRPIPCGAEGSFDHGLDYDEIDDLDEEVARHLPAVLAIGRRIEQTAREDLAARDTTPTNERT